MSETPKFEKQQYLEGPWKKVSGDVPLTQFEVEGGKEDLDKTFGEANWQATPNAHNPNASDLTVSPDHNSVYATMTRNVDRKGSLGDLPPSDPAVKAILSRVALEEAQQSQPAPPEVVEH